jgi:hypothetical protein
MVYPKIVLVVALRPEAIAESGSSGPAVSLRAAASPLLRS